MPDKDLGKATKPNTRNVVWREEDQHRAFGVPAIRNDIPTKKFKSVANYQNYGDEPEAIDLIFPANYQEYNVVEDDFKRLRSREEIKELFEKVGYTYKIGKFNAMYNLAKEICQSVDDRVNVRAFQGAIGQMHNIE